MLKSHVRNRGQNPLPEHNRRHSFVAQDYNFSGDQAENKGFVCKNKRQKQKPFLK